MDIENCLGNINIQLKNKTLKHVITIFEKCGRNSIFGYSIVEDVTGLKSSRASEIIKLMLESKIIEPVIGKGKGKYKLNKEIAN